jgi:ribonucleoside-triphosphate reductase
MDISQKILSDLTVHMKYAKYVPELQRRETWEEIVTRNMNMHIKKYPQIKEEIIANYRFVYDKKVLPSMRALENNTPIITKNGWKKTKDVVIGDILYSSSGKETKVIDTVSFENKDLFKITFSDNSSLIACNEHLWIISTNDDLSKNKTRVVDTNFLIKNLKQGNRNNISIWNPKPIVREKKEFHIEPYILGLWLGDGYSSGYQISTSVDESKYVCEQYNKYGYTTKKSDSSNLWTYSIHGLAKDLKKYNLLNNKHIPEEYLFGSIEQRLSLIQGLMDSDGHVDKNGRCHFYNTNKNIIVNFKEILSSLGIIYTISNNNTKKEHYLDGYTINFYTSLPVVTLPNKKINLRKFDSKRTLKRKIKTIENIGKGGATCFHVDSEDNSFLAGKEMIVTHNSMQFAGKPIEISPNRLFNCSFLPIDHIDAFSETMFLLLGGSGVGFSVQKHHVENLPEIRKPNPNRTRRYLIGDSIEGWADAIKILMKSYFGQKTSTPIFDFSDIRPKGSLLVTSGGKAPGPQPLKDCVHNILSILDNKQNGDKLLPIEVHDIVCHIADSVLAGGIRRAALISLFSADDNEMLSAKTGAWWETNPQRGRANNSVVLLRHRITKDFFNEIWKRVQASGAGEPGIFFTNDKDMLTNPCAEISLKPTSFCNLTELNVSNVETQEDLNERAKVASFIGTLQAGYTDFHYLRDVWQRTTEKESLLGVSMTGIGSGKVLKLDIKQAAKIVKEENERVASLIGIKKATRTTAVKPSGTASLVLGTSSGIHAWHNEYYLRRIRVGKNEAIYTYLSIYHPELIEDEYFRPHDTAVITIPQKAPEGSILRNEKPIDLLKRIKKIHNEWIKPGHRSGSNTHNVSATISLKDNEWDEVGEWMWENRDFYNGLSVLPYDSGTYQQAPFEDCTKEQFEELFSKLHGLDLTKVVETQDNTDLSGELACAGPGGCEIK